VETFEEAGDAFMTGAISGLSITAPFKEDAFAFAQSRGAAIGENALACGAVNTLVNVNGGLIADNTDVDGFTQILAGLCGRDRKTVALLGAGGTARAALAALQRAGMRVVVYNRTEARGRELAAAFGAVHEPLDAVRDFDGEIVINTLTSGAAAPVRLEPGMTYVESGYGHGAGVTAMTPGVEYIGGLDLLHAQAARQHELFMKVFDES
jgi:shikimate dehydrogenase